MHLLLTGFEPFGGSSVNPSGQVAQLLNGTRVANFDIAGHILPVDGEKAPRKLIDLVQEKSPQSVLCLGEAPRRPVISIERLAVNLLDYRIPDNRGKQITDQPVREGSPAAYFTTLPVRQILDFLFKNSIPAELSLSAGSYLCNQVLYTLLDHLATHDLNIPAGFIHLPSLPEQVVKSDSAFPSMDLETEVKGIKLAIEKVSDWMER